MAIIVADLLHPKLNIFWIKLSLFSSLWGSVQNCCFTVRLFSKSLMCWAYHIRLLLLIYCATFRSFADQLYRRSKSIGKFPLRIIDFYCWRKSNLLLYWTLFILQHYLAILALDEAKKYSWMLIEKSAISMTSQQSAQLFDLQKTRTKVVRPFRLELWLEVAVGVAATFRPIGPRQ